MFNRSVIYCIQSKVPAYIMKAYADSSIGLHLLNFGTRYSDGHFHALAALNGYGGPFHPAEVQGERAQIIHSTEPWVSPKVLMSLRTEKSFSFWELNHDFSVMQPTAQSLHQLYYPRYRYCTKFQHLLKTYRILAKVHLEYQ